ncbi:hypothetical protein C5B85_03360 [Pseudoclavibacter sp. AY1F1]|nr:hypothetical protein C5B85_03360 [Pseudoclavibacter sp. AY1F1]
MRTRRLKLTQRNRRTEGQECWAQDVILMRHVGERVEDLRDTLCGHARHLLEDAVGGVRDRDARTHPWWAAGECGPQRTSAATLVGEPEQGERRSFDP